MSSQTLGKAIVYDWIKQNIKAGASCLDVGACDGVWARNLGDFLKMDAVEAYEPNVEHFNLRTLYNKVFADDVRGLQYGDYELVIFGDVLEHMSTEEAQDVLRYAEEHADVIVVAVPYKWKQDAIYGNPYEKHIQDDLTRENVKERYPELVELVTFPNYGYYYWRANG